MNFIDVRGKTTPKPNAGWVNHLHDGRVAVGCKVSSLASGNEFINVAKTFLMEKFPQLGYSDLIHIVSWIPPVGQDHHIIVRSRKPLNEYLPCLPARERHHHRIKVDSKLRLDSPGDRVIDV